MQNLAEFEGYADNFTVKDSDLLARCFGGNSEATALVAEANAAPGELLGMAVYYSIPYTYDLCPDFILKELYVAQKWRGSGVGHALMNALVVVAGKAGCKRIRWQVLRGNDRAKRFYESLGAREIRKWESWGLELEDWRGRA